MSRFTHRRRSLSLSRAASIMMKNACASGAAPGCVKSGRPHAPRTMPYPSTAPIAAVPELELVASDGTPFTDGKGTWRVFLSDGGRKLKFGPVVGTRILVK